MKAAETHRSPEGGRNPGVAELTMRQNSQGPACTMTGVASSVCSSVGCTASFISTARAPLTPRSSAVTGLPAVQPLPVSTSFEGGAVGLAADMPAQQYGPGL